MDPREALVVLVSTTMLFGIPLSVIWTSHKRKMLELQLRLKNEADGGVRTTVEALREEVRSLRDTTMQYDISFDTALQRMEQRVAGLERRVNQSEAEQVADLRTGL